MIKNKFIINLSVFAAIFFSCNIGVQAAENTPPPSIYGKSAITVDMQTGEIIYEKNIDTKVYPASTTKLMTAIILSETKKETSILKYTKGAKLQPPSSLNSDIHKIDVSDTMTASSAMYGMLMHSANDIAYMIAENVSKTVPDFASRMNAKAKEFGLQNTHFVTPNGLHNANHYSTAYDMSIITKHAFKIPWIRKTINTKTKTIKTSKGVTLPLKNTNKLLGKDGCIGGKTGYTVPAGRCLVTVYERSGRKILGVVMDSVYDPLDSYVFNDMKRIIDWSYKEKPSILIKKGSIVSNKTLKYKPLGFGPSVKLKVPIRISQDVKYYNNSINNSEIKETTSIYNVDTSKLKGNTPIGKLNVKQRNYSKDYYLYSDISSKVIFEKSLPFYIAVLAVIAIVAYFIRRKVKAFLNV